MSFFCIGLSCSTRLHFFKLALKFCFIISHFLRFRRFVRWICRVTEWKRLLKILARVSPVSITTSMQISSYMTQTEKLAAVFAAFHENKSSTWRLTARKVTFLLFASYLLNFFKLFSLQFTNILIIQLVWVFCTIFCLLCFL